MYYEHSEKQKQPCRVMSKKKFCVKRRKNCKCFLTFSTLALVNYISVKQGWRQTGGRGGYSLRVGEP